MHRTKKESLYLTSSSRLESAVYLCFLNANAEHVLESWSVCYYFLPGNDVVVSRVSRDDSKLRTVVCDVLRVRRRARIESK